MGFAALLGNERLRQDLSAAAQGGKLGHFYLLSGPEGAGKRTLARLLAAAMECTGKDKPCGVCRDCRKALNGTHPDVITVDDPEKKTVPVELIRSARADLFVRPGEGARKVYLFPRAQDLGLPGQNALLKALEEPPAYGAFILLTDNPAKLLPTVRSRCIELRLQPLSETVLEGVLKRELPDSDPAGRKAAIVRSGGFLGQARKLLADGGSLRPETLEFARCVASREPLALLHLLIPLEKSKREPLAALLTQWLELVTQALSCRAGLPAFHQAAASLADARRPQELMRLAETLKQAIAYTRGNVSPAAVCGWLEWSLR